MRFAPVELRRAEMPTVRHGLRRQWAAEVFAVIAREAFANFFTDAGKRYEYGDRTSRLASRQNRHTFYHRPIVRNGRRRARAPAHGEPPAS